MKLDRLILDNFLTYEHLDYEIGNRPLLVQGRNLTEDNQSSNGSGKSGIFAGIEYGITATNSRDVRDAELVMFGCSKSRVQLFASCDSRKESIHIDWTIKLKGSNVLTLKKMAYGGDWKDISFSSINDGKKYILQWFDISKEDIFNYYVINKSRFKSFFKTSNKEKVDLINRFSDTSIIEGIEDIDVSDLEEELGSRLSHIVKIEGKIERVEEDMLNQSHRDLEGEINQKTLIIKEKICLIEERILDREEDIVVSQRSIKEQEEGLMVLSKELKELDIRHGQQEGDINKIEEEVSQAKGLVEKFLSTDWQSERNEGKVLLAKEQDNLRQQREQKNEFEEREMEIQVFLQSVEVKLRSSIKCPSCKYEFVVKGDIAKLKRQKEERLSLRETLSKDKKAIEEGIERITNSLGVIEKQISVINEKEFRENKKKQTLQESLNRINHLFHTKVDSMSETEKSINEIRNEISAIKLLKKELGSDINNGEEEIKNLKKEIDNHRRDIEGLKKDDNKQLLRDLRNSRKSYRDSIKKEREAIEDVRDRLHKREQWRHNFKQFRMFLANQSLETIQYHCNRYLREMSSDLRIVLEGFKMLATGIIREEIVAKVIRDTERTFSSFSGGERGRLLFAAILANRHMINSSHQYGGLDFLCIDEVFEGVDSVGLQSLIEAAKRLGIAVMIITHVTDEEIGEDTLLIEKVNSVSRIVR